MKTRTLKNAITISSVYLGTILGAGFASGQEMLKFFALYGYKGMFGLLLTGMLFGIIAYMVLKIVHIKKCRSFKEFIEIIIGKTWGRVLEIFVILFMFICFSAMFAGTGALFEQRFHIPYAYGVLLMAGGCFLTFLFEVKGVVAINAVLAPLLLLGTLILGLTVWMADTATVSNLFSQTIGLMRHNWIASSIIYVSYNSVTAIVVLCSLGYLIKNKRTVALSGFLGGLSLGIIGLILGWILLTNYDVIVGSEIPILKIVMDYHFMIQYIYIGVLVSAMFTTAVANGFGIIEKLKVGKWNVKNKALFLNIGLIIGAISFSSIGFSTMVGRVYPIFGYIGIFEICCIGIYFLKNKM